MLWLLLQGSTAGNSLVAGAWDGAAFARSPCPAVTRGAGSACKGWQGVFYLLSFLLRPQRLHIGFLVSPRRACNSHERPRKMHLPEKMPGSRYWRFCPFAWLSGWKKPSPFPRACWPGARTVRRVSQQ